MIGCVKVVAATAVTAAMLVVTNTSVDGIGMGGKVGCLILELAESQFLLSLVLLPFHLVDH